MTVGEPGRPIRPDGAPGRWHMVAGAPMLGALFDLPGGRSVADIDPGMLSSQPGWSDRDDPIGPFKSGDTRSG